MNYPKHFSSSMHFLSILLWPLAMLFRLLTKVRRVAYRIGFLKSTKLSVPVLVIGNITVGGTGKTPLVIYFINFLIANGYRPGVISRGYKGKTSEWPQMVDASSDPQMVGDEPVMIAQRCACPVVVGPDRVETAERLIQQSCNVIVSDDGLQHYKLQRDFEVLVIDCQKRFGNGRPLPAGPLRESVSRLHTVDVIVNHGGCQQTTATPQFNMQLSAMALRPVVNTAGSGPGSEGEQPSLDSLAGQTVHAVAGIGNPDRFFSLLEDHRISVIRHAFPDHHQFQLAELQFNDKLALIMTEKDAVKCHNIELENTWYIPVNASINSGVEQIEITDLVLEKLGRLQTGEKNGFETD